MSRVFLLAADKPLPLCNCRSMRTRVLGGVSVAAECGFAVEEHAYYREAVADLGYDMKAFRYEVQLDDAVRDLAPLRDYLSDHVSGGEAVELWSLWVGGDSPRPRRYRGAFEEFDSYAMAMLFEEGQICLTILF